jgi:hypothetical protein
MPCSLRLSLELLLYPLIYHSYLQRLGLIPATPLFPPAKAFIPFSVCSPLLPFSLHYDASVSTRHMLKAALTSPFVFVCLEHLYEQWVYNALKEAIQAAIIQPTNTYLPSPEDGSKARKAAILGLQRRSSPSVRNMVSKLLAFIGWGKPHASPDGALQQPVAESPQRHEIREGQSSIGVGENQVTNLNRLDFPRAHTEQHEEDGTAIVVASLSEVLPPAFHSSPPLSPTVSQTSEDEGDPSIRITSREGVVEMEVRLPAHVLSSYTEPVGSETAPASHHDVDPPTLVHTPGLRPYHRVRQLSSEPAQMIRAILKARYVTLATLPLKLVTLRLVASHYLANRHGYVGPRGVLDPFPLLSDLNWVSIGVQVSRIAFCEAFELAIDLGLWGLQYFTLAYTGANTFGCGTL